VNTGILYVITIPKITFVSSLMTLHKLKQQKRKESVQYTIRMRVATCRCVNYYQQGFFRMRPPRSHEQRGLREIRIENRDKNWTANRNYWRGSQRRLNPTLDPSRSVATTFNCTFSSNETMARGCCTQNRWRKTWKKRWRRSGALCKSLRRDQCYGRPRTRIEPIILHLAVRRRRPRRIVLPGKRMIWGQSVMKG